MSNIYIQEPPTSGKVLLTTSVGDIDIELWSKEAPRACRNFVQLCMEGYYNGTIFHRVVRDFIIQGGDPSGTGHGGESIWGKPFKDEIHSRLRFTRRGLVAMANAGPHDNASQFFFTLAPAPELNNKHTIFGKIGGNTIYNALKLVDCEIGENDRPMYPHKIIKTKVLASPFEGIIPRNLPNQKDKTDEPRKKKSTAKATKNFKLLSFGAEAEEDEEEVDKASQSMRGKSKSSHDLLNDDKLSALPAVVSRKRKSHTGGMEKDNTHGGEISVEAVSTKLKKDSSEDKKPPVKIDDVPTSPSLTQELEEEDRLKNCRLEALKKEQEELKKELSRQKRGKESAETEGQEDVVKEAIEDNDVIAKYKAERKKFTDTQKKQERKGGTREQQTLALLEKFRSKLSSAKMHQDDSDNKEEDTLTKDEPEDEENEADPGISWLGHKLEFDSKGQKVIDANVDDSDRYEIYDPRNPLTKRRREASKHAMKK